MKQISIFILSFVIPFLNWAQCAMCRTQVKNNVSNGETDLAEGLNNGIMFLFFTPYIIVFAMIALWYRYSKINERRTSLMDRLKAQVKRA